MRSPVVFVIFRRPDLTAQVFERIAAAKPPVLLVIADGPRGGDEDRVAAARAVVERVDWPCEVLRDYADVNLGVERRFPTGMRWAFEQVDRAIILEDDCLPDPTFFPYCDALLERYADDARVWAISGHTRLDLPRLPTSYYFSTYPRILGWATWRRAWRHYDVEMREWETLRQTDWLESLFGQTDVAAFWAGRFDRQWLKQHDGWDFPWQLAVLRGGGLVATPRVNLVRNLGMYDDPAHVYPPNHPLATLGAEALDFPLRHPPSVAWARELDMRAYREVYLRRKSPLKRAVQSLVWRVPPETRRKLKRVVGLKR